MVETTALGVAMLAATGAGLFPTLTDAARAMAGQRQRFDPAMNEAVRSARLSAWEKALASV
jgi:glycerol kinase